MDKASTPPHRCLTPTHLLMRHDVKIRIGDRTGHVQAGCMGGCVLVVMGGDVVVVGIMSCHSRSQSVGVSCIGE